MNWLHRFLLREDGPTVVEYAVMLATIVLVCVGTVSLVGGGTLNFWEQNCQELESKLP